MIKLVHSIPSLVLALSFIVTLPAHGATKSTDQIPTPVLQGLQAHATDGFSAAVDIWIKNSVLDGNAVAKAQMMQLADAERFLGKPEGHQLLRISLLTPRVQRVYVAIYYERSALWAYFDVFEKKTGEFIISEIQFNTKAGVILPADFFYR